MWANQVCWIKKAAFTVQIYSLPYELVLIFLK